MKTIDTRGYTCPRPLIMLKEALLDMADGEKVEVLTDNDTSLKNLTAYLQDQGVDTAVESSDGTHRISTSKPESSTLADSDAASYCSTDAQNPDYVVVISGELMGQGDNELGLRLMNTFVENLKLQDKLPTHVILYNGGVKLAMKERSSCSALVELEDLGCRIMLCGTCVDHYQIQYDIGVGMISDMVSITETMAATGHVVKP